MKTKNNSEKELSSDLQPDPRQKRSMLWIGAIFFISGWAFFLGVIVGRGTAPALFDYKKIETEMSMLTKVFTANQKSQNEIETDIPSTQARLGYPEELVKKTEESAPQMQATVNQTRPTETPRPIQALPPSQPKSDLQTVKTEPIEHTADSIKTEPEVKIKSMYDRKVSPARETAQERTAPAAPERTPAAIPKPQPPAIENKAAAAQPVAIHLTSLVDKKSADALIESLRSKGISASKTPKMIQGKGVWYTVVIGKYASLSEADVMLNRLKQENMDASLIKQ